MSTDNYTGTLLVFTKRFHHLDVTKVIGLQDIAGMNRISKFVLFTDTVCTLQKDLGGRMWRTGFGKVSGE